MLEEPIAAGYLQVAVLGVVVLAHVFIGVRGGRLTGRRARFVHQHPGEEAREAGDVASQGWHLAWRDVEVGRELVEIHDLVEVRDEGVRQEDHRRTGLLGRIEGIHADAERLLDTVGIEGDWRVVAARPESHLHDVALAGHGRHARRWSDSLHVDEDRWHAHLLGVADGLLHQAESGARCRGEGLGSGQAGADDRVR